MSREHQKLSVK